LLKQHNEEVIKRGAGGKHEVLVSLLNLSGKGKKHEVKMVKQCGRKVDFETELENSNGVKSKSGQIGQKRQTSDVGRKKEATWQIHQWGEGSVR